MINHRQNGETDMPSNDTSLQEMERILDCQQMAFHKSLPIDNSIRIDRLKRAIALLADNAERINEAVKEDWSRSKVITMLVDVADPISRLKHAIKNLPKWTRPEKHAPNFPFGLLGAKAHVERNPVGTVGIISPWNAPVMLSFSPLAAAFAAGNSAMIKPSEYVPTLSELMKSLVSEYFEEHELAVITGGYETGKAFSSLPFNHLVFTGGSEIAKDIMRSAADNLTPVTLELGGKSPAVVAPDADIEQSALRILTGKGLNGGQVCVTPDYVFVPEDKLPSFIEAAKQVVTSQYPDIANNDDYCGIVNQRHFDRLTGYLQDARDKGAEVIATVTPTEAMQQKLKLPMHFVINPPEQAQIMQEEIFGPAIIIKTYTSEDQVIEYIQSKPNPLALYFFGGKTPFRTKLLNSTLSGDVTINDVLAHSLQCELPFGGVGNSGNGSCYGIEGFRRLSHSRSIYKQTSVDAVLNMLRPPFGEKALNMVKSMTKK